MKRFFAFFLTFCLCLTMPFVLSACDKDSNKTPVNQEQNNNQGEHNGNGEDNVNGDNEEINLENYSIVLENVVFAVEDEDEPVAIDFAELQIYKEGENLAGRGYGKVYKKESNILVGDVEAVLKDGKIYFEVATQDEMDDLGSSVGAFQLSDLVYQTTSDMELPFEMSIEELVEMYETNEEDMRETAKQILNKVFEIVHFDPNIVDVLAEKVLSTFFASSVADGKTTYTLNFEALKTINHTLATVRICDLFDAQFGEGAFDNFSEKLAAVPGMTVGELYEELEALGFDVEKFFTELDELSAMIGEAMLSVMPEAPVQPSEENNENQTAELVVATEVLVGAEEPETAGISTLEELLAYFGVELPLEDISEFVLSDAFKENKLIDIINVLTKSELTADQVEIIISGSLETYGKKSVYEVVESVMAMFNEEDNNDEEPQYGDNETEDVTSVGQVAEEGNEEALTFAQNLEKQVNEYIEMASESFSLSFTLDAEKVLHNLTVELSVEGMVELKVSVVKNYKTTHDYSALLAKVDDLQNRLTLTLDKLPLELPEESGWTVAVDPIGENGEEGTVVVYETTKNVGEDEIDNISYVFEFDANEKLVKLSQYKEENTTYGFYRRETNVSEEVFENYTFGIVYHCESDYVEVSLMTVNGYYQRHDSSEYFGDEDVERDGATFELVFDLTTNKYVFGVEVEEHEFVEKVEDREELSYGVKLHYVCEKCHVDYYEVVRYSPNEYIQGQFTYETWDYENAYLYNVDLGFMYTYDSEEHLWTMTNSFDLSSLTKVKEFSCYGNYYVYVEVEVEVA